MNEVLDIEKKLTKEAELPLEQKYLALLVAAHYLGGALRILNNGEHEVNRVSGSDLQVALTESGNDVEDGKVAAMLRSEATRLGVDRHSLDDVISVGFKDAFNFIHGTKVEEDN